MPPFCCQDTSEARPQKGSPVGDGPVETRVAPGHAGVSPYYVEVGAAKLYIYCM